MGLSFFTPLLNNFLVDLDCILHATHSYVEPALVVADIGEIRYQFEHSAIKTECFLVESNTLRGDGQSVEQLDIVWPA